MQFSRPGLTRKSAMERKSKKLAAGKSIQVLREAVSDLTQVLPETVCKVYQTAMEEANARMLEEKKRKKEEIEKKRLKLLAQLKTLQEEDEKRKEQDVATQPRISCSGPCCSDHLKFLN